VGDSPGRFVSAVISALVTFSGDLVSHKACCHELLTYPKRLTKPANFKKQIPQSIFQRILYQVNPPLFNFKELSQISFR